MSKKGGNRGAIATAPLSRSDDVTKLSKNKITNKPSSKKLLEVFIMEEQVSDKEQIRPVVIDFRS